VLIRDYGLDADLNAIRPSRWAGRLDDGRPAYMWIFLIQRRTAGRVARRRPRHLPSLRQLRPVVYASRSVVSGSSVLRDAFTGDPEIVRLYQVLYQSDTPEYLRTTS